MNLFIEEVKSKVIPLKAKIVFPEGNDPRVLNAISMLRRDNIELDVFVLGDSNEILSIASERGVDLKEVEIIDWKKSKWIEEFVEEFYQLRKHKGVSKDDCYKYITTDVNGFGAMMVKKGIADCMVSGSLSPTADVIRAAIWIVRSKENIKTVSSVFVMFSQDKSIGDNGKLIFSDCALVVDPTSEQLADIAINASNAAKFFLNQEPMVALLSYSTYGSGSGPSVDKVREAVKLLRDRNVGFKFDGELQFDAAFSPKVANIKCPSSEVAGHANTYIFPNLDSGNIGYKIAQRIGKMEAYGPLLVGLNKPINDLSRGCSSEDIYVTSLMTLLQLKYNI
ncbi:MAG: phosphate acetyltransferase [Brevinematia bacterium]